MNCGTITTAELPPAADCRHHLFASPNSFLTIGLGTSHYLLHILTSVESSQKMAKVVETSVIIVGGSIVGLSQALFLAHRKVPFILLERHTGSAIHPRAIGYTARTIETFRAVGMDQRLPTLPPVAGGRPRRVKAKALNGDWTEETLWTRPRPNAQNDDTKPQIASRRSPPDYSSMTPVQATAIAQDKLEPLIREEALRLGADLRLGTSMTQWSQDEEGVSVTATDQKGHLMHIRAKYLVACDGAESRVRKDLGIPTTGVGYIRSLHSILFRCPSIDHYLSKGIHQWELKNDDFEALLVSYGDGRWALMTSGSRQQAPSGDEQKKMVRRALGLDASDIDILAEGHWNLSGSVAARFSSKRVFLAGDAAHALPPNRGGYGANTGISDAHNLAWKLQAVLSGSSDASLLATYDQERRPVALVRHDQIFVRDDYKSQVAGTDWERTHRDLQIYDDIAMELGQVYRSSAIVGMVDETEPDARTPAAWRGQPGTRAPHIRLMRKKEEISSLDLFGEGWTLLTKDGGWKAICGAFADVRVVLIGTDVTEVAEDSFLDAFGVKETGAALIRPDGYIAARWELGVSANELAIAYRQAAHSLQ